MTTLESELRDLWNRTDKIAFELLDAGQSDHARDVSRAAAIIRKVQFALSEESESEPLRT